jgi:LysR family transcriptional regulator, transcriptional activator of the cysJI operon
VTLHQLKVFEAVARLLNVTAAAKGLGISQPAVSLQLRLLEEEYRCQFFTRSNHGVSLTERGQKFLAAIQPILDQLTAIKAEFSSGHGEPAANSLVVGANSTLTDTLLPDMLTDFKEAHPGVDIVVRTADSRTLELGILDSGIGVALITKPSFSPDCTYEVLEEYEPVAFVPYDSDICCETMTLEQLARYPLIARRGMSCVKELMARGYKLKFALECDAPETVISVVRRGWGVGFLFSARLTREISRGSVRIIQLPELSDIKRRSYITYDRRTLTQSAQDFINVLRRGNETAASAASPIASKHLRPIKFKTPRVLQSNGDVPSSVASNGKTRRPASQLSREAAIDKNQ